MELRTSPWRFRARASVGAGVVLAAVVGTVLLASQGYAQPGEQPSDAQSALLVKKVVIPPKGEPVQPLPKSFTIKVFCSRSGQHVVTFDADGGTKPVFGVRPGEKCTVIELGTKTFPPGTVVTGSPQTVIIPDRDHKVVTATVINDFSGVKVRRGTVQVVKKINGTGASLPKTFTALVKCDHSSDTVTLPGTGGPGKPVSVRAGDKCTVTEVSPPSGFTVTYVVDGGAPSATPPTFKVRDGKTVTVTIINTPVKVSPTATAPPLPVTGTPSLQFGALAGGLIVIGSAMLLVLRRRRAREVLR